MPAAAGQFPHMPARLRGGGRLREERPGQADQGSRRVGERHRGSGHAPGPDLDPVGGLGDHREIGSVEVQVPATVVQREQERAG